MRDEGEGYFLVRENHQRKDCAGGGLSDAYTQLAIQGPRRRTCYRMTDAKLETIKNYWFTQWNVCGLPNT